MTAATFLVTPVFGAASSRFFNLSEDNGKWRISPPST